MSKRTRREWHLMILSLVLCIYVDLFCLSVIEGITTC